MIIDDDDNRMMMIIGWWLRCMLMTFLSPSQDYRLSRFNESRRSSNPSLVKYCFSALPRRNCFEKCESWWSSWWGIYHGESKIVFDKEVSCWPSAWPRWCCLGAHHNDTCITIIRISIDVVIIIIINLSQLGLNWIGQHDVHSLVT